jgi:hypothetical protein
MKIHLDDTWMNDPVKTTNEMANETAEKMIIQEIPFGADEMLRLARASHHFEHIIIIGLNEGRQMGVYANIVSPQALLILEDVVSRLQSEVVCNA